MRHFLLVTLIILVFSALIFSSALADESQEEPYEEPYSGAVVCLPDRFYKSGPPGECLEAGPAAYVRRMASMGITFPIRPFPGEAPDPALTYVDIRYGQVVDINAPVYASLEDAVKRKAVARRIDSPYSFISYMDEAVVDGKRFYMVDWGGWMTANEVSRIGTPSLFQGLEFKRTPQRPFGWVLYNVETKRTPGNQIADYTGNTIYRYEVVEIMDIEEVGGLEWYMIAPNEWIPADHEWQRLVGRVIPSTNPPEGVENGRWIEVNLFEQTVAVYENRSLKFATLTSTGIEPFWTRPGLFQIYDKLDATPMRGAFEADRSDAYYLEDVPWTMYYDEARALHGAYWHNSFGGVRSHGCVNLSVGDARWIFDWAQEGDWVYVWDPSGETPTDPALYGEGGA
jgi:hypothetical protein